MDTDAENSSSMRTKTLPMPRYLSLNDVKLTISYSDGDSSRWPDEETPTVSSEGNVDYLAKADLTNERSWKRKIATNLMAVAELSKQENGQQFVLSNFPEGYKLFLHRKGRKDDPRRDYYLYGGEKVFRSPNEFVLHALWLADGGKYDEDRETLCLCRNCGTVKSQSALSRAWSGPPVKHNTKPGRRILKPVDERPITFKDYTVRNKGV